MQRVLLGTAFALARYELIYPSRSNAPTPPHIHTHTHTRARAHDLPSPTKSFIPVRPTPTLMNATTCSHPTPTLPHGWPRSCARGTRPFPRAASMPARPVAISSVARCSRAAVEGRRPCSGVSKGRSGRRRGRGRWCGRTANLIPGSTDRQDNK